MRNKLRVFTKEHRDKISIKRKELYSSGAIVAWQTGKTMTRDFILKNMKAHLKYEVSFEWLNRFEDIAKLKYLNGAIKRKRDYEGFTSEIYKAYVEKFYNDKKFNELFSRWKATGDKWIKPSLDHIIPKANQGGLLLDNLQFISWLENRAKVDMLQSDWKKIKSNINYYL